MENGTISRPGVTSLPPPNLSAAPCMPYRPAWLYVVKILPVKVCVRYLAGLSDSS